MKYKAIIFDLFGTLVRSPSNQGYLDVLERMAAYLSVPPDDFNRVWFETARERNVGTIQSIEDNIIRICEQLRVHARDAAIGQATRIRLDFVRQTMRPRPDAIEVLAHLKSQGFKVGLISNCSPDAPVIWQDTPLAPFFDLAVFSSSAGMRKPDPRIYLLATEQLGVKPKDCLYVGDGASQELPGAARIGMSPVMIQVFGEDFESPLPEDARGDWDGPRVSSLTEVLKLLK
jgi:putative hydrolase of the HAD superfamily